jgi:hypothetical protein
MATSNGTAARTDRHSFSHQTSHPGDLVLAAGPKVYAPGPPTNAHEALTNVTTGFFAERVSTAPRGWPLKDAAPLRGHLVGVSLEGAALSKDMVVKRTAAVLRVADVASSDDGVGAELVLYVRLQRPVATKHGLKACTPEDVPYFRLNNAEARRLLCNLKIAAFDPTTAHNGRNQHHPYVLSILVSMHALGDLTEPCLGEIDGSSQPVLKSTVPGAFANGNLTVVCLPPLSQELEKCFALLGHSLAVGTVATTATKGDDGDSDAGSTASDEVPICNKLDPVWCQLRAKTAEAGNQFRSCTQALFDLSANRPRQEVAAVLTETIPNLSARSSGVGTCVLQDVLAHFVGDPSACTASEKRARIEKMKAKKTANGKPASGGKPKPSPAAAKAPTKPAPFSAKPAAASAPKAASEDDDDDDDKSESWDMSEPDDPEADVESNNGKRPPPTKMKQPPKAKRAKGGGGEGDLDSDDDDFDDDVDLDSEEEESFESEGEENEFTDDDEEAAPVAPSARPAAAPAAVTTAPAAPAPTAAPARRPAPQYTNLLRELERLLDPSASLLGWIAAPLGDKVTALKTAIHDWEREDRAPSPDALLAPIVVDLVHALHALAERRDAAGAVAMPAEEAARVRTMARDAHALGIATLPVVGDAISDVRALEARLVQLQRRGAEVFESIGRGLPGASAEEANSTP